MTHIEPRREVGRQGLELVGSNSQHDDVLTDLLTEEIVLRFSYLYGDEDCVNSDKLLLTRVMRVSPDNPSRSDPWRSKLSKGKPAI